MPETVKIIVTALKPEDIVKCISIVAKVRKYVQRYVGIHIFLVPNVKGFNGITVEDEVVVECDDEEKSIEQIIDGISRVISRKRFLDLAIAAAETKA